MTLQLIRVVWTVEGFGYDIVKIPAAAMSLVASPYDLNVIPKQTYIDIMYMSIIIYNMMYQTLYGISIQSN